jgi:hypothetical protein
MTNSTIKKETTPSQTPTGDAKTPEAIKKIPVPGK